MLLSAVFYFVLLCMVTVIRGANTLICMPINKMSPIMFFCIVLCTAATNVTVSKAANILVFMPLPCKSHFRGFQPLFKELSHRGHNVTVASSFPLDHPIANYTDIGPFVYEERGL